MKHNTTHPSVDTLYRKFASTLVGYVPRKFPILVVQDAEEVVQNLFVTVHVGGTRILGDCSSEDLTLRALKKHVGRHALDFIRRKRAGKRGGDKTISLDAVSQAGFEPSSEGQEPEQELYLRTLDFLDAAYRIIDVAIPLLSERELILVRHIRRWAPVDLSVGDLSELLTPVERLRFLPSRPPSSTQEADDLVVRQISRSKANLHRRLRETRDSLDI